MARRTTASAPPPDEAPEAAAPTTPTAESGFFTWLRALGLQRQSGWLGGVCGGIAARIGIDPLLVRGIAVVLAVVGAPVALLYALAWFLLPDETGTIHAQQLGRGRVTRALPGIVAVFLASFLPLTQGFWYAGSLYWGDLGWGGAAGRIIWTAVLIAGAIVLVVWLARRASGDVTATPATTDDRPETVPSFPAEAEAEAEADAADSADVVPGTAALAAASASTASAAVPAPLSAPSEPPAPPADASAEELAAWKASQNEWQQQRAAWAAEQRRSERERRQAVAREQAVEAARLAQERSRIRRLTRPRASAGIVFLVLGVALIAGAIAAFTAAQAPTTRGAEWMIGAAVLVLALGLGTVAVALGRRRSGALAFFSMLAVLALVAAVVVPGDRTTLPPGSYWSIDASRDGRYAQLAGTTQLVVQDRDGEPVVIDLWQLAGNVQLDLADGATVRLEFITDAREHHVSVQENFDGSTPGEVTERFAEYRVRDGRLHLVAGEGDPDVVLRLWAGSGTNVRLFRWTADETPLVLDPVPTSVWQIDAFGELVEPTPTPTPTPTLPPTPDPGAGANEGGTP